MDKRALIVIGIVVIVVVFVAFFILSLSRSAQNRRQETVKEIVGKENIPAVDVVRDPLVYDGLSIQVEAPILDWVTKRSFTVSTEERRGILNSSRNNQLLVITEKPLSLPKDTEGSEVGLGEVINVRIKGKARIVNREELSRILNIDLDGSDIKLDDNEFIEDWEEGSVILAESVEKL